MPEKYSRRQFLRAAASIGVMPMSISAAADYDDGFLIAFEPTEYVIGFDEGAEVGTLDAGEETGISVWGSPLTFLRIESAGNGPGHAAVNLYDPPYMSGEVEFSGTEGTNYDVQVKGVITNEAGGWQSHDNDRCTSTRELANRLEDAAPSSRDPADWDSTTAVYSSCRSTLSTPWWKSASPDDETYLVDGYVWGLEAKSEYVDIYLKHDERTPELDWEMFLGYPWNNLIP